MHKMVLVALGFTAGSAAAIVLSAREQLRAPSASSAPPPESQGSRSAILEA